MKSYKNDETLYNETLIKRVYQRIISEPSALVEPTTKDGIAKFWRGMGWLVSPSWNPEIIEWCSKTAGKLRMEAI